MNRRSVKTLALALLLGLPASSADTAVPTSQSKALDEHLKAAGVRTKLVIIDGVNHEWSGKELPTTANASRKAIAETFDWLERTMMNGM